MPPISPLKPSDSDLKAVPYERIISPPGGYGVGVPPDTNADEFSLLYQVQKDVYRCVFVISTSMAALPWRVMRALPNSESDDVTDSQDFDVLRDPYPLITEGDFWEATSAFLELTGECPWYLPETGPRGRPTQIVPLRPDKIEIIPSATEMIGGYRFIGDGGAEEFDMAVEDVVFLKYFNPNSDYRGLSPLRAGMRSVEMEIRATTANISMLKSGGFPSGIVMHKNAPKDNDVWERFKRDFREHYEGEQNQGNTMFLRGDVDWKQMGVTPKEMSYPELIDLAGDGVGEIYGVPPILRMKFKEASKLANAAEQTRIFWDVTIRTKSVKLAAAVSKFLLPRLTDIPDVRFVFDLSGIAALQPDRNQVSMRYDRAFKTGGVSPNDVREFVLNLARDDDPAMDLKYIAQGYAPIGAVASLPPVEEGDSIDRALRMADDLIGEHRIATPLKIGDWDPKADVEKTFRNIMCLKAIASLERIREIGSAAFEKILSKLFEEQESEIVSGLLSQRAFWGVPVEKDEPLENVVAVNIDVEEWAKRFEDEGKPHIAAALLAAAKDLADSVDGVYDFDGDPDAVLFVNERSRRYANMVNSTTSREVDDILRGALAEGLSVDEASGMIERYFEAKRSAHAGTVARTEMIGAANKGRMNAMKANDYTHHTWYTQRDDRVRDAHTVMDGEEVAIGQNFSDGTSYPQQIQERCYTVPTSKREAVS